LLTASNGAQINGALLDVNAGANIAGGLVSTGTTTLSTTEVLDATLTVGTTASPANFQVTSAGALTTETVAINGALAANSEFTVNGDADVTATLDVTGATTVGSLSTSGALSAATGNFGTGTLVTNSKLTVTGQTDINTTGGATTTIGAAGNATNIGGTLTSTGLVTANNGLTVTSGDLNISSGQLTSNQRIKAVAGGLINNNGGDISIYSGSADNAAQRTFLVTGSSGNVDMDGTLTVGQGATGGVVVAVGNFQQPMAQLLPVVLVVQFLLIHQCQQVQQLLQAQVW